MILHIFFFFLHFWKQFSHKVVYNYCSTVLFFLERFGRYLIFSKTDLSDVVGFFHIWALKFGVLGHMTALKIPRGMTGVVCDITHLWPYPTIGQHPSHELEESLHSRPYLLVFVLCFKVHVFHCTLLTIMGEQVLENDILCEMWKSILAR